MGFWKCKICGKILVESNNKNGYYSRHFKQHDITDNYQKYLEPWNKKCKMCENYVHNPSHIYCSNECKWKDKELNKKRGQRKEEILNKDDTLIMECQICKWTTTDIHNISGSLTKHQHNKFKLKKIKPKERFICPICGWSSIDIENKSGQITTHLKEKHNLTPNQFVEKYKEYRNTKTKLWKLFYSARDRKEELELKENQIECKICGKKFFKITNSHLKLHNITLEEYRKKYGKTCSERTSKLLSEQAIHMNKTAAHIVSSKAENEIYDFIKNDLCVKNILQNDRKLLDNGKELDLYLPDHRIAIEYNGLLWHSEFFGNKNKDYHLEKTDICLSKGIRLIQIFSDEWENKKEIVKQRLKYILNKTNNKIYARKCIIKEVLSKDKKEFLEKYHLQGNVRSKIKIGLFYKNELISLMTFGSLRRALGQKEKENYYELLRFVSNTNVLGGASKLFSYFVKNYNPTNIISYADRRWNTGMLYETLGFKKTSNGKPNYWYTSDYLERTHRFNYRKSALKNLDCYNDKKTELEIMLEAGFDRVWDCGSYKFEYSI